LTTMIDDSTRVCS